MDIIALNNQIEEFVQKYDLSADALALKKEHSIASSAEWQKVLDSFAEEGRVLRVGIIGRVKAGKSSMLNALLFDGQDILPKAATPMTAALTIMEYSDTVRAEVDFFTQGDIDEIRKRHDQYQKTFAEKKAQAFEENQERALRRKKKEVREQGSLTGGRLSRLSPDEIAECEKKADTQTKREMKNYPAYAAYDQYSRMQESGKTLADLTQYQTIHADSIEALMNGKLNDFVGAGGAFMPFTKSVTLHIPHEGLKGLQIIDTPGINDPVTSRGERTEELLQHCDVVLVVSPSGQFLSAEDTDLLHRITTNEGTQEAYLIASQVDNQLFGNECGNSDDPVEVLARITATLTAHARSVLQRQVAQFPEMKTAADKLSRNDVICSSGVAYAMSRRFGEQDTWDGNMQHVLSNLAHSFPVVFDNAQSAQAALNKLANIDRLRDVVADVTTRKTVILQKRRIDFETQKRQALRDYLNGWEKRIGEQIHQIETADVGELRQQKQVITCQRTQIDNEVGGVYADLILEANLNLDKQMKDKLNAEMRQYTQAADGAQGTTTESKEVYKGRGGFLWLTKEYKTATHEVNTVNATSIRRAIEEVRSQLEDNLNRIASYFQLNWKKTLYGQVVVALRQAMGDDEMDITLVARVLKNILAKIPEPDFRFQSDLPSELRKWGTLKQSDADDFNEAAENYIHKLSGDVRNDIGAYVGSLTANLRSVNLAKDLSGDLEASLKQLLHEIENKETSLFYYNKMKKELAQLQQSAAT